MARSCRIQAIIDRHFPPQNHPYRIFEQTILSRLEPNDTVLDIGCGRQVSNLSKLKQRANVLIGIDMVDFEISDPDLVLLAGSICDMGSIATNSIDLAYSRSVMEHIRDVEAAYAEVSRALKPNGRYIFLTPNFWDYASLIAYFVPNALHGKIVRWTEGRSEEDTFPTFYRSNTYRSVAQLAEQSCLTIAQFDYLGQYPNYFRFSKTLFRLASRYEKFLERYRRLHCLRGWILCTLCKPAA
jgi:SAM-dependent methyltransferase